MTLDVAELAGLAWHVDYAGTYGHVLIADTLVLFHLKSAIEKVAGRFD